MTESRKPIVVVGSINMDLVTARRRFPASAKPSSAPAFRHHPRRQRRQPGRCRGASGLSSEDGRHGRRRRVRPGSCSTISPPPASTLQPWRALPAPRASPPSLWPRTARTASSLFPAPTAKSIRAFVERHADLIRSAGMVLCQLELPIDTLRHILALCAEAGVPVMLDPAPAAHLPDEVWTQISMVHTQ